MTNILLALVGCIFNAFALKVLWGWFVAPAFAVGILSMPTALGITIIADLLTGRSSSCRANKEVSADARSLYYAVNFLVIPAALLCIGWVVHLFV